MPAGTIWDIITKLNAAKNYAEVQPVIADLMEKVTAMHHDNRLLSEENAELKSQVARAEDFRAKAEGYKTHNEDTGVVTYVLKAPADHQQEAHRFCAHCFQNSKISYLQRTHETRLHNADRAWFRVYECNDCGSNVSFNLVERMPEPPRSSGDNNRYY